MKVTKIILTSFLVAFFALGTVSEAQAQKRERPSGKQGQRPQMDIAKVVEMQTKWFEENFKFNDEQIKRIKEIHDTDATKRKELMDSGLSPRGDDFREKMDALNIFKEAELEEVLTREQWASFEEKKEDYYTIGKPQRPGRNG